MPGRFIKITTIFVYIISIIALATIIFGFVNGSLEESKEEYKIGNIKGNIKGIVFDLYNSIDNGHYENLYDISLEGKWIPKKIVEGKRQYSFNGIVEKDYFLKKAKRDFGGSGWRIHFTSVKILDVSKLARSKFENQFTRESMILDYFDTEEIIKEIYIVKLEGYIIGSCSIVDWNKDLPIVRYGKKWKAIVTGTPEDYDIFHREQWLTDINFEIDY